MSNSGDQGGDDPRGLLAQKEEFLESFFRRGAEFARELLEENDRLRRRVVELEEGVAAPGAGRAGQVEGLAEKIERLEQERAALLARFSEIEQENNELASLLVAQSQLHASLDAREVLQVIVEVLLNFVGADRFAVLLLDEGERLRPLVAHAVELAAIPARPRGQGIAGQVLASSVPHVGPPDDDEGGPERDPATDEPRVCFPLQQSGGTIGVVAIWSFLPQKGALAEIDTQIFTLIAGSGSRALEAARLASDAAAGVITPPRRTPFEVYAAFVPEAQ